MRVLADTGRLRFTNTSHHVRGMALRLGWKTGAHNTILFMAVTSTRHSPIRRHRRGADCVPEDVLLANDLRTPSSYFRFDRR
jgi:hypothetical protein